MVEVCQLCGKQQYGEREFSACCDAKIIVISEAEFEFEKACTKADCEYDAHKEGRWSE